MTRLGVTLKHPLQRVAAVGVDAPLLNREVRCRNIFQLTTSKGGYFQVVESRTFTLSFVRAK